VGWCSFVSIFERRKEKQPNVVRNDPINFHPCEEGRRRKEQEKKTFKQGLTLFV